MLTIILLLISNIFMTFAWYGHLRYQNVSLWKAVLASWSIALFEYCFQVSRQPLRQPYLQRRSAQSHTGDHHADGVFVFSVLYLKQSIKWNHALGFFFIVVAAFFLFKKS